MEVLMNVDAILTSIPVNVVPLIDDTDFKTIEDAIVYNQAGLDLVWNFITTAGVQTQTAVTPTETAGDYDWSNLGNGMYGIGVPASLGASINNDSEGIGWFSGFATGVLPFRGPMIAFRAQALNDALLNGGDNLVADVTATAVTDIRAAFGTATDLAAATVTAMEDTGTKLSAVKDVTDLLPDSGALTSKANEATVLTVDTVVDNILVDTNELQTNQGDWATATGFLTDKTGFSLSAAGITAVWSESLGDGGLTVKQALNLGAIFAAAKASGGNTTTITLRNLSDTVDAVVQTVDSDGNRTEVVITL